MSALLVYIQTIYFDLNNKKEEIFILISFVFSLLFCSSMFPFFLCLLHLFMGEVDDPSQDLSSPYHVSSSDNPSFLIIPIILEGPNYHQWSRSFQMSLISKNKIGFIDGTIDPNRTNSLFPTWQRANMLVVSWILKAVSQSIA